EELDSDGKVTARKQKVYRVWFRDGTTHARLVEVNGQPPAAADLKKQAENEMNLRQMLGGDKSASKDTRGNFICPELVARFDFQLIGESVVNNRRAYEVTFRPRQPRPP